MGLIKSGRIWPYAIATSILMVFGFCVATVAVTQTRPVEDSDTYMMNFHHVEMQANELIQAKIDFNKRYKIEYVTKALPQKGATIQYKVTDLNGNAINDADLKIVITRPNHHKHDQELTNPSIQDGIYSFSGFELAEPGRWDIMAKVAIGENQRFYNVKADTRAKGAFEY